MPKDVKSAPSPLWHPRYWPSWLVVFLLRTLMLLPLRLLLLTGSGLGLLGHAILGRRRRVTATNVRICFPERSASAQAQLVRAHFAAAGRGIIELLLCWWARDRTLENRYTLVGAEHLQSAIDQGQGVILLSAHFTSLEISTRFLSRHFPVTAMYKPHRNPVFRQVMQTGRDTHADVQTIAFDDIRSMLRALKGGAVVWYAPDQGRRIKFSAILPFFGHPAVTNIATGRIARMTGAAVVPFFMYYRPRPDGEPHWQLVLQPALDDVPSGDDEADGRRINALFENAIQMAPEQYLWMHRKFKGLPDDPVY